MDYIYYAFCEWIFNGNTKAYITLPRTSYMAGRIVPVVFHEHRGTFFMPVSMVGLSVLPGMPAIILLLVHIGTSIYSISKTNNQLYGSKNAYDAAGSSAR